MGRVLIVAPDPDLRHSLHFALEADGHAVTSRPQIAEEDRPVPAFDCTVLDHRAARGLGEAAVDFCVRFHPVILLVSMAGDELSSRAFETLFKPMLGPALSQAVRRAVELRDSPK